MNKIYINNQIETAKYNYNYFIMKMIIRILQVCFKLSCILLISGIFNYTIIYTIMSLFSIYDIVINYKHILEDIANTLGIKKFSFEIDLNVISNDLFKGMISYGK